MNETRNVLVFDYDGVLADTERLHWKSWAALLLPYDIQLTWEEYCSFGQGVDDAQMCLTLGNRVPQIGTPELFRRNSERRRMVRDWSLAEIPIPQETVRLLTTLAAHRIGLVTSSEQSDLEPVLRAAAIFDAFDAMVFGSEVAARKPAPDPYLLIARKLGVKTGIAFEDSVPGVESARAAGFEVVRVEQPRDLAQLVARSLHGETTP